MDRTEIMYYFNQLLSRMDKLTSLLELSMNSEGMTRVDDDEIEELFYILHSPLDRAVEELEILLYEYSERYRENDYEQYGYHEVRLD